jgi:uncharacterized membrane protein
MALITCPDCGNSVSDAAPACIHCGRPMRPQPPFQDQAQVPPRPSPYARPVAPGSAEADPYGMQRKADARAQQEASAKTIAWVIYGLQILSFLYFIPGILGLVLGYAKRGDTRGTFLESHFDWQIATFWKSLWWGIGLLFVVLFVALVLEQVVLGTGLGYVLGLAVTAWYLWRVIRGALALNDNRAIR